MVVLAISDDRPSIVDVLWVERPVVSTVTVDWPYSVVISLWAWNASVVFCVDKLSVAIMPSVVFALAVDPPSMVIGLWTDTTFLVDEASVDKPSETFTLSVDKT